MNKKLDIVPDDWKVLPLSDVANKTKAGGTPDTQVKDYWNGSIPLVKVEDVVNAKKHLRKTNLYISEAGLRNSSAYLLPEDSIIFTMYGTAGEAAITTSVVAPTQNVLGIVPNPEMIETEFLYYALKFSKNNSLENILDHTIFKHFTLAKAKNLMLNVPVNQSERNNISYVLSTLQKAIQKQEEIINTTTALKKSLLNKLFTEGTKGEPLKQTPLGMIPESWQVVPVGKYINFLGGFAFKSSETVKSGSSKTQLIRMGNLYQNKLDLKRSPTFYPDDYAEKYSRYILNEGDLIISLTGTMGKEDYGFTVQVPAVEYNLLLNQRVAKLIIDEDHIDRDFVRCFMLSRTFLDELYSTAQGTKQANLSTNTIQKIPFLLPKRDEQKLIAKAIMSLEKKVETAESKRNIYENIFKTLLHELMTGSLRVNEINFKLN